MSRTRPRSDICADLTLENTVQHGVLENACGTVFGETLTLPDAVPVGAKHASPCSAARRVQDSRKHKTAQCALWREENGARARGSDEALEHNARQSEGFVQEAFHEFDFFPRAAEQDFLFRVAFAEIRRADDPDDLAQEARADPDVDALTHRPKPCPRESRNRAGKSLRAIAGAANHSGDQSRSSSSSPASRALARTRSGSRTI